MIIVERFRYDELTMLMQLNDPRIAVLVFDTTSGKATRVEIAEEFLNEKLIAMNFSHILNPSVVSYLEKAEFLANLSLNGKVKVRNDNAADYLVIGNIRSISTPVRAPSYEGMKPTSFINSKSTLKVEIIKYDTGEIIGTFTVDGNAVGIGEDRAKDESLREASATAAEKLAETFKKFSAKATQSITFTIKATNESNLQQIINNLRSLGIVDSVYIREQKENTVVLSVETAQKPNTIVTALKDRSKLKIIVQSITNSTCTLSVR